MFAGILLLCPSFTKGVQMPTPVITISPDPPVAGRPATITYTGAVGTVLTLEWDPAATPTSAKIGRRGTAVVDVPANATSLVISDPTGGAQAIGVTVSH